MGRIEKSIEIKAAPDKVWEMLALDRLIEWSEGFKGDLKRITEDIITMKTFTAGLIQNRAHKG